MRIESKNEFSNHIFYPKIKNFSWDEIGRFNFYVISNRSKIEGRAIYHESNHSIFEDL